MDAFFYFEVAYSAFSFSCCAKDKSALDRTHAKRVDFATQNADSV